MFTGPNIVRDGLVLALDAGNTKSYPGSGTTWYDLSGNGYNASLLGGPTFNSNNEGSISFDGTNDRASIDSSITSLDTSVLSIEMYFRTNASTSGFTPLIAWHDTESPHGYICLGNFTGYWSNESISFYNAGTGTTDLSFAYTNGSSFLQDTNWHHTLFVLNTSDYRIYVDGSEVTVNPSFRNGTSSTTFPNDLFGYGSTPSVTFAVGSSQPTYGNLNIALTRIYNKALTASEVLQNYNATKTRFGL